MAYYGYRYYDPKTGRWPSRDPLGDEAFFREYTKDFGFDELERHDNETLKMAYGFVDNDPINKFDENGLISSVHAAIARAMATGNVTELTALLECGIGTAAQQAAMRAAIARLNSTAQQIIAKELKGKVIREFPKEMLGKSLSEISKLAKGGDKVAQKAKKLLNDKRFKK